MLLQTGYLTIQEYIQDGFTGRYALAFPNKEVEQAFSFWLAVEYSDMPAPDVDTEIGQLRSALRNNDLERMFVCLKTFFAGIPYELVQRRESWYQTLFFTVFKLLGADVEVEVRQSRGRVDSVVKTKTHIYVLEFKLTGSAQSALDQIRSTGYADPYKMDGRQVTCVGVAFDPETRNIGEWLSENY